MVTTDAVLTCPSCGHADEMTMPEDRCVVFHECSACGEMLRPQAGDCCVFCSYANVDCPPEQAVAEAD